MKRKQTANKPITRKPTRQYPTRTGKTNINHKIISVFINSIRRGQSGGKVKAFDFITIN